MCHCASPPKKDLMLIKEWCLIAPSPGPQPRSGFRLVTVWLAGVSPPGHPSSGAADCARATAVTATGPPHSSRPLPAQPGGIEPRSSHNRRRRGATTSRAAPTANPPPVVKARSAQARTLAANATRIAEDCVNGVLTNTVNTVCSEPGMRPQTLTPAAGRSRPAATRSSTSRRMQQLSPTRIPRPPPRLRTQSFSLMPGQCDRSKSGGDGIIRQ